MSLFIGNLPPHIQREELEHEFGRFGKSYIKLKDGYGFAVYEAPEDAERALRALRGKDICGGQTTLTWSNRQPKSFQKFSRINRFYEQHIGRNIRRENNVSKSRDTYGRRDFVRRAAHNHRAPPLLNPNSQEVDDVIEKTGVMDEKGKRSDDGFLDVSSPADVTPDENDRWGEPIPNTLEGDGLEGDTMFERYEPKYDFDSIGVEEKQKDSHFSPSPTHIKSLDKEVREHSIDAHVNHTENSKPKPVCYKCGLLGHIIRNCPRGTGTMPEKFSRFHSRKDGDILFKVRGVKQPLIKARSWRRNTTREMPSMGHQASGSRDSQSGKRERLMGTDVFTENNEHYQMKQRMVAQGRKRSKHGDGLPGKLPKGRRRRRSISSYSHESSSRSSLSGHSYYSHSRSSISLSCSSRSTSSASSECRSGIHRSKARYSSSLSKSLSSCSDMKATPLVNNEVNAVNSLIPASKGDHASSPRRGNILSAELDIPSSNKKHNAANSLMPASNPDHVSSPRCGDISSAEFDIPGPHAEMEVEVVDTSLIAGYRVQKEDIQYDYKASQFPTDNMRFEKEASLAALDQIFSNSKKMKESIREKADHEGCVMENDTEDCKSTRMSLQEVHVALKHYGLKTLELCKPELSVKSFFGAARLWPWQIIYYRRLKKGPISTENYDRRVAQNKEFGIIDKYVRSSSGWGES